MSTTTEIAQAPTSEQAVETSRSTRQWVALAVLALTALLLSLDVSVLYLALPDLSADLGASTTQQLWMLDIYSFVLAGFLVTMGAVGDRVGRKRLLLIGAVAFGIASACAAYASSPGQLDLLARRPRRRRRHAHALDDGPDPHASSPTRSR